MKRLIYMISIICFLTTAAKAEYINSVYYNPVPHGKYDRLMVSDNLNIASDLQSTGLMQIGTSLANIPNLYKRTKSLPEENTQIISQYGYGIDSTSVTGEVSFPKTTFYVTEVSGQTGTGLFTNYTGTDNGVVFSRSSEVGKLAGTDYGVISRSLNNAGTMTVTGSGGTFVDGRSTETGLVLANYDIAQPTVCTGNPRWVNRKDSNNVWHKVLGCAGTTEPIDCSLPDHRREYPGTCCVMPEYRLAFECGELRWDYDINECQGNICYGSGCGQEEDTCGGGGRSAGPCEPEGATCYVREVDFDDPDNPSTSMGQHWECWITCTYFRKW